MLETTTRPRQDQEITLAQAAKETGLSNWAYKAAIQRGRLQATLVGDSKHAPQGIGNVYVVTRRDLEEYLATRSKGKTAPVDESFVWSCEELEDHYRERVRMGDLAGGLA